MKSKIRIRAITEEDTDKIIKWRNDPSVNQYFIYRKPFTRESHLNWLHNKVLKGEAAQFIIMKDDESIGTVYLRDIDHENKKCEFGIFIGEDSNCGKGYGRLSSKLIIDYAFNILKLNKVFLRVFSTNMRAIKCYEKIGFQQEGLFREDVIIDGKPFDLIFMSILKKDWLDNNKKESNKLK